MAGSTLLIFGILAFLCEVLGTIGGFGSSVFFVPLAQFFFSMRLVLGLTAMLHVFSNLAKIILFRKSIDLRLTLLFGVPSVIAVIIGAVIVSYIEIKVVSIIMSGVLIIFSVIFFVKKDWVIPASKKNAIAGGSIAGFLAGLTGTGGAIRGASMAAYNLEKNLFVGTSAAIDMGVDFSRAIIYIKNGFINSEHYFLIPVLFVVSIVGSYIGKILLHYIKQEYFRNLVLILIFIVAVISLIHAL